MKLRQSEAPTMLVCTILIEAAAMLALALIGGALYISRHW
jgi:hypothetical protein